MVRNIVFLYHLYIPYSYTFFSSVHIQALNGTFMQLLSVTSLPVRYLPPLFWVLRDLACKALKPYNFFKNPKQPEHQYLNLKVFRGFQPDVVQFWQRTQLFIKWDHLNF